ncbi:MAG TPA: ATP-binding protein [Syntrophomonadaceae bacterium]|nr:ATP-binding protein [Syntrophomonadaceae bacterium]
MDNFFAFSWPGINNCTSNSNHLDHFPVQATNCGDIYRRLIEDLADGFLVVDTRLNIMYVNPALVKMLGYAPDELINHNLLNFSYSHQDQLAMLRGISKRRIGQKDCYEVTLRSKTGSPLPTYINPAPLYDDSGNIVGSYGIIKDLTELKEAQIKISYQAQILDQISEGVFATDAHGQIQYYNKRLEQILGINNLMNHPATIELIHSWVQLLQDQHDCEIEYSHPDGSTHYLRLCAVPLAPMDNSDYSLATVVSDLTAIIRARREAEMASQAKTSLLTNISHDIRTPMLGIIGASELMSKELMTDYQRDLILTIQQCSEVLLGLINDILDLSRIEAGFAVSVQREFYLQQLVEECLLMIQTRIDPSKIMVYTEIDPDIPNLLISDPLQLRRIMLNLLSNAAKFTSQGHITIRVRIADNPPATTPNKLWLEFSVEDSGVGIPEDKLSIVFDAFQKANVYDGDGSGLGLAICRELVKLLGGNITVTSQLGQGTTFTFVIPVEIPKPVPMHNLINSQRKHVASTVTGRHILVVDDNDVNRRILTLMLKRKGFAVLQASNGFECLSLLQAHPVDIVLMDMQMPVLSGYETVRQIRCNPRYSSLPIIALTASSMDGEQHQCLQAGCNAYLAKPFSSETLFSIIDSHLVYHDGAAFSERDFQCLRKEFLPEFIAMLELDLVRMRKAQENRDWESVAHIAHDIKGTAGMYGFEPISQLAAQLYSWSNHTKLDGIEILLTELENALEKLKASRL